MQPPTKLTILEFFFLENELKDNCCIVPKTKQIDLVERKKNLQV